MMACACVFWMAVQVAVQVAAGAPELAPRPVDHILGRWAAPPCKVPSNSVVDGPLLGSGSFGAVVGSDIGLPNATAPSRGAVTVYLGRNDFFAAPTNGFSSCGCESRAAPDSLSCCQCAVTVHCHRHCRSTR